MTTCWRAGGDGRWRSSPSTAFASLGLQAERFIRIDRELVRPVEPTPSVGDPTKARRQLGWQPRLGFEELVERMVQADVRLLQAAAPAT